MTENADLQSRNPSKQQLREVSFPKSGIPTDLQEEQGAYDADLQARIQELEFRMQTEIAESQQQLREKVNAIEFHCSF